MFKREAYAVAVHSGQILIKRLKNRPDRWYFPGGQLPWLAGNAVPFLLDTIKNEIGGVKVQNHHYLGSLLHNGNFVTVYLMECIGNPDRRGGIEAANFVAETESYHLSSLGRKILSLFEKQRVRNTRNISIKQQRPV